MYFPYGWPKAYATDHPTQGDFFYVHSDHHYVIAVGSNSIQVWTGGQHRIRLGSHSKDAAAVEEEGCNISAHWCPQKNCLTVLTSRNLLHLFSLHVAKEELFPARGNLGLQRDLKRIEVYVKHTTPLGDVPATCVYSNSSGILLGFKDGSLATYNWLGKLKEQQNLLGEELAELLEAQSLQLDMLPQLGIVSLDYSERMQLLALVLSDGSVAMCKASECGLSLLDELVFSHWVCEPSEQAVCVHIGTEVQLLAVGTAAGEVQLYRLLPSSLLGEYSPGGGERAGMLVRCLSLGDWGHKVLQTGAVSQVAWSPDCRALAVGYHQQGLVVWSPSGCRLMCSLRQTPALQSGLSAQRGGGAQPDGALGPSGSRHSNSSSVLGSGEELSSMLESGIGALAWGPLGYQLALAEVGCCGRLLEVLFAKTLPHHHRVAHAQRAAKGGPLVPGEELHLLQAHDRLLLITEALGTREAGEPSPNMLGVDPGDPTSGSNDLAVHHVQLPISYLNSNWPLTHAAVSSNGLDIAVAGRQGLALYSRQTERWRLFGDVSQERRINCLVLGWLDNVVVCCSADSPDDVGKGSGAGCALLLFPKYHLDFGSLLLSHPLGQQPAAMDCAGRHILLASEPLELALLEVQVVGDVSPLNQAKARVSLARELSIASFGRPLRAIALVPGASNGAGAGGGEGCSSTSSTAGTSNGVAGVMPRPSSSTDAPSGRSQRPQQCVLLRWGGLMSVLDMERGSELQLSRDVESFWLSETLPVQPVLPGAAGAGGLVSSPSSLALEPEALGRLGVTDNSAEASTTGAAVHPVVEMPWWAYGPKGMQLWFPSLLQQQQQQQQQQQRNGYGLLSPPAQRTSTSAGGSSPPGGSATDIELEFDQEVYPVGISLADAAIVGVTQRMVRAQVTRPLPGPSHMPAQPAASSSSGRLPCFYPVPESQPVLPCLLRRLLQQGAVTDALLLANKHQRGPHFARSLEWLLFTALESETAKPATKRTSYGMYRALPAGSSKHQHQQQAQPGPAGRRSSHSAPLPTPITPLLNSAAELVRSFPQFADVVVSVARKTDASLWPALFTAVGSPSVLLEGLLEGGQLRSAACFLLVVDRLEGATIAHALAVRLVRAALRHGQYFLCAEILRFIVPPGDMDSFLGLYGGARAAAAQGQQQQQARAQQGRQQAAGAGGGGYLSWLGWFWGGGSSGAPEPPRPEEQQKAAAAVLQASSGRQPEQLQPRRSGAADPGAAAASLARRHSSSSSSPGVASSRQDAVEGSGSEGMTPGVHACQLVADHAWQLLDQGQLGGLAQLIQALSFTSGGLLGLMRVFVDPAAAAAAGRATSAVDLLSALSSAVRELPVWENEAMETSALRVLELCQALGMESWTLAVGVLLVDMAVVLPFREAQPHVWRHFAEQLRADTSFYFLHEIVDVLSKAPLPESGAAAAGAGMQPVAGAVDGGSSAAAGASREIQVAED